MMGRGRGTPPRTRKNEFGSQSAQTDRNGPIPVRNGLTFDHRLGTGQAATNDEALVWLDGLLDRTHTGNTFWYCKRRGQRSFPLRSRMEQTPMVFDHQLGLCHSWHRPPL